jgi:hypothetical protein
VKPEFEKITKEVNILNIKAKDIRRYNYTTEQNLEPIEGALEGLQESLVAYEEVAKRANNPDGALSSSSLLMCRLVAILLWMFKGHAFVDVHGQIAQP